MITRESRDEPGNCGDHVIMLFACYEILMQFSATKLATKCQPQILNKDSTILHGDFLTHSQYLGSQNSLKNDGGCCAIWPVRSEYLVARAIQKEVRVTFR